MTLQKEIDNLAKACKDLGAAMKKENFWQRLLITALWLMMLNWLITMFYGWSQHPELTQMQVLLHSLDFFEWNFELK